MDEDCKRNAKENGTYYCDEVSAMGDLPRGCWTRGHDTAYFDEDCDANANTDAPTVEDVCSDLQYYNGEACVSLTACEIYQKEMSAPTPTSDWVCAPKCPDSHYYTIDDCLPLTPCENYQDVSSAPTPTSDRVCTPKCSHLQYYDGEACIPLKACSENEFEHIAPTPTSDRVCVSHKPCENYQNVSSAPTPTSDRVCTNKCSINEYYNDGACIPLTACEDYQDETSVPTPTSDRVCTNKCPPGMYYDNGACLPGTCGLTATAQTYWNYFGYSEVAENGYSEVAENICFVLHQKYGDCMGRDFRPNGVNMTGHCTFKCPENTYFNTENEQCEPSEEWKDFLCAGAKSAGDCDHSWMRANCPITCSA